MREKLRVLLQSGQPLIGLATSEERRAIQMMQELGRELQRPLWVWSVTEGLTPRADSSKKPVLTKPQDVLQRALAPEGEGELFILKDLSPHVREPIVARLLRDLQHQDRAQAILLESGTLPDSLRSLVVSVEMPLPNDKELELVVRETFRTIKHRSGRVVTSHITKREFEHLVQTLRGLTLDEAGRVVAAAIYADGSLTNSDLPRIIEHKRQRLHTSGCLESILVDVEVDELGGLENLKRWLALRRQGFTSEARAFGLSPPRGMLLLGVQGCGKSLCAKMVASDWGMPLLRLDPGTLYNRFVGESENRLRQALSQAEAIAPAVLWIDEIEKAFAFASADSADGGLSQRMFGTLLTWMQDHRAPLFIVATANDIAKLPPELMRKGRFDEVFFVDLPRPDNRAKILATHLRRRQRDPQTLNLEPVVAATEGFSGAELEQLILAGLFEAYQAQSELTADILVDVAQQTQPLAILMRERVNELRRWAAERCVPADKIS